MDQAIKHFDIDIDKDNYEENVRKVLKEMRPDWKKETTKIEKLGGGFVNTTLKITNNGRLDDGLILRINGELGEMLGFSRQNEIKNLKLYNKHGFGPQLHAMFNNGLVSQLSKGKPLNSPELVPLTAENKFYSKLARHLAQMHHATKNITVEENRAGSDNVNFKSVKLCMELLRDLKDTDEGINKVLEVLSLDEMEKNCISIQSQMDRMNIPTCLQHNDVWNGNILYDPETEKIDLIDFEISNVNYETFDIATYILCVTKIELVPGIESSDGSNSVESEFLRNFAKVHLEEKATLEGRCSSSVTEEDIEKYMEWINFTVVYSCTMLLPVIAYVMYYQAKQGMDIDYVKFVIVWCEETIKLKKEHGY